jgi:hypothetical protein
MRTKQPPTGLVILHNSMTVLKGKEQRVARTNELREVVREDRNISFVTGNTRLTVTRP